MSGVSSVRSVRVAVVGSRSLPPSLVGLVAPFVAAVVASGAAVVSSCCVGADRLVVLAALRLLPAASLPRRLVVFAAFGPGGAGSSSAVSAVAAVLRAARRGACVRWACGPAPRVPFRVRLFRRALALVGFVAAGAPGSCLVAVLASPSSRGSLRSCALAARAGVPVGALCAFSGPPLPVLSGSGLWSRVPCLPLPAGVSAWRWCRVAPAQLALPWSEAWPEDVSSW